MIPKEEVLKKIKNHKEHMRAYFSMAGNIEAWEEFQDSLNDLKQEIINYIPSGKEERVEKVPKSTTTGESPYSPFSLSEKQKAIKELRLKYEH